MTIHGTITAVLGHFLFPLENLESNNESLAWAAAGWKHSLAMIYETSTGAKLRIEMRVKSSVLSVHR